MPTREEYQVRVIYQSGHIEEFWVTHFEITRHENSMTITYTAAELYRPIDLGINRVESLWQIATRTKEYSESLTAVIPPSSIKLN